MNRALNPSAALAVASVLAFAGAFLSLQVAATVAEDIVDVAEITPTVVFAGLLGAIAWNLATLYNGLPSSSTHALIGGLIGAAFAAAGADSLIAGGIVGKVLIPALLAPLLAFLVGGASILIGYRVVGGRRPGPVIRGFRLGQLASGSLLALAYGTNDAQKTMGVIVLALVANGSLDGDPFEVPGWVVVATAAGIALGTYAGGLRLLRGRGGRVIKMDAAQGFSAQTAGAAVVLASSSFGFPVSTTHVISGGVMGAGAGKRLSAVRWGVAGSFVAAWLLTLPAAAALGAAIYGATRLFGTGALGPIVVALAALCGFAALLARRRAREAPLPVG
jgi:PiT family inorganic phosphate transporter